MYGQKHDFKGKKFGSPQPWKRFDDRGFEKPQLHDATCANCGNACQVPFKPNGRKPIYCRECFKKDGDTSSAPMRFDRKPSFDREEKRMFDAECDKCGNDCQVPFRPTGERPVYCRECFGKNGPDRESRPQRAPEARVVEYRVDEFKKLNEKLDAIVAALGRLVPAAPAAPAAPAEKAVEAPKAPKAAAKKKAVAKKKK